MQLYRRRIVHCIAALTLFSIDSSNLAVVFSFTMVSVPSLASTKFASKEPFFSSTRENVDRGWSGESLSEQPRTWNQSMQRISDSRSRAIHAVESSKSSSTTVVSWTASGNKANRPLRKRRRRRKTKPLPVIGYNARAIEDYYNVRPFQVAWRLNCLGFPFLGTQTQLPCLVLALKHASTFVGEGDTSHCFASHCLLCISSVGWYLSLLLDRTWGIDKQDKVQRLRGQELRSLLVKSKSVALIKSGQAASLRPDLIRSAIWAEELGKLVDAVGAFPDMDAMKIMQSEFSDLRQRLKMTRSSWINFSANRRKQDQQKGKFSLGSFGLSSFVENDDVLSLFEFDNDYRAVASASIGQVYKARIRRGPQLEAAIGKEQADKWGGRIVAIKVQRPDVHASASMDMYLLRRAAIWLGKIRGGNLPQIADAFGMQLFGELDYNREANNCERFRDLYGDWKDLTVPRPCYAFTRRRVLVMDWIDGTKGPWEGQAGIE
jgi:hypothetical protein